MQEYENIRNYKDDDSKAMGQLIQVIGVSVLRELNFSKVRNLMEFLKGLEY